MHKSLQAKAVNAAFGARRARNSRYGARTEPSWAIATSAPWYTIIRACGRPRFATWGLALVPAMRIAC